MKVKALCIKPIHGVYIDEAEVLLVKSNENNPSELCKSSVCAVWCISGG